MADADAVAESETNSAFPFSRFEYDAFLSFRGEDTRHTFTTRLFNALTNERVRVFMDSEDLKGGDEVSPKLIEAINDSALAIAVISPRYADSRWCLEELATLVKLRKVVMPVFYEVDPSDVRRQRGRFAEDFKRHETDQKEEKVKRWRMAMEKVGGTSGWDSKLWEEQKLIQTIVKQVLKKVSNIPMEVAEHPTGLGTHIKDLLRMLDVNANGVRIVHLYGMGGIGKTTLAKAVYNKLVVHFRRCSFVPNVRETWGQLGGEERLKKKLHDDLRAKIRETDSEDKVLIVLDDVDNLQQFHALATERYILNTGSRLIITSRDAFYLSGSESYEVTGLTHQKSLKLFSYHAFGKKGPPKGYMKLSEEIVGLAKGLPLALEVFGSFLLDKRRMEEWRDALQKLKQTCPGRLHDILKISYRALDREEQCIFLDLACFFVKMSMKREDVVDVLRGCGFNAEIALAVLVSKCLIKIIDGDTIWMHDSLREMGREIVLSENPGDPGMRSRIWDQEAMTVIRNNEGTRSIHGIALEFAKDSSVESERTLDTKALKPMSFLRLLKCDNARLQGSFSDMPTEIKWLQWKGCPLEEFPDDLYASGLDLSMSTITHLWNGCTSKMAKKLMFANLSECRHLKSIPDLSGHQILKKLNLRNCKGLLTLHQSVGELSSLVQLDLEDCSNLMKLPTDVSGLKCLEKLILTGCSKLKELPQNIGYMTNLKELNADRTALETLPHSINRLEYLRILTLTQCGQLKRLPDGIRGLASLEKLALRSAAVEKLPDSIGYLVNLKKLDLRFCLSLDEIPTSISKLTALERLYLGGDALREVPSDIGSLSHLKVLSILGCKLVRTLPDSIGGLASLKDLALRKTALKELPVQIGFSKMLEQLDMGDCDSLERLPKSFGHMLNMTRLTLSRAKLTELPECIGMMERLHTLKMEDCKHLKSLPASIGNLKSLCYLTMTNTALTELPEALGMLSSLRVCKMSKLSYSRNLIGKSEEEHIFFRFVKMIRSVSLGFRRNEEEHFFPRFIKMIQSGSLGFRHNEVEHEMGKLVTVPKSFSNLSSLEELNLLGWKISGKIPDELEQLKSLETLKLDRNNISHLPADLRGLSILKYLFLSHCKQLTHLPPLPPSLIKLDVSNCTQLESISDLSDMEYLEDLNLAFCVKVSDIPGLECLKALRRLFMGGCELCFQAVKSRFTKATLRHLHYLSVPASEIPVWFVEEVPNFKEIKHRSIKAALIGVVISLDQQQKDDYRDHVPAVVDIEAKIFRHNTRGPAFRTALNLKGVPDTNKDQLYVCRYTRDTPLILSLKEGDRVEIAARDPPIFKGIALKKYGIHLIYDHDDDIGDNVDEDWLDESEQSISNKLAAFLNSL